MSVNGGGIIPYSKYKNEIYLLLGREDSYDPNWHEYKKYGDFGGGRDGEEKNIEAVAREAYEESNGLLGPYESLLEILNDQNYSLKLTNFKSDYYFVQIPYVFFIDKIYSNMLKCQSVILEKLGNLGKIKFDNEIKKGEIVNYLMHYGFFEKDKIKYFSLKSILNDIYDNDKKKIYRKNFIKLMKKFNKNSENYLLLMQNELKIWKFNTDDSKLLHPCVKDEKVEHMESEKNEEEKNNKKEEESDSESDTEDDVTFHNGKLYDKDGFCFVSNRRA